MDEDRRDCCDEQSRRRLSDDRRRRRTQRSLFVDSTLTRTGAHSVLYCHVTSSSSDCTTTELIDLGPTRSSCTLVKSRVHRLAARVAPPGDAPPSAAQLVSLAPDRDDDDSDDFEVEQVASQVVLMQRDRASVGRAATTTEAPAAPPVPLDLVVVLELVTTFGPFENPKFANIVTIPVPPCRRNMVRFTLPPPSARAASAAWDLKVHPSLFDVEPSTPDTTMTIAGSFAETTTLSIRWTPRVHGDEDDAASSMNAFALVTSRVRTEWTLDDDDDDESARARVAVEAEWEYAGLGDQHWVRLEVVGAARTFDVSRLEGPGVVGWDRLDSVAAAAGEEARDVERRAQSVDAREPTPSHRPRRRRYSAVSTAAAHAKAGPNSPSLFDTAPPIGALPLDHLDASVLVDEDEDDEEAGEAQRGGGGGKTSPSLLRQPAPFDPGPSGFDASFDDDAQVPPQSRRTGREKEHGGPATSAEELLVDQRLAFEGDDPEPEVELTTTTILVKLSLSELVAAHQSSSSDPPPRRPTLQFDVELAFAPAALEGPTVVPTRSSSSSALRLALPTFSLPDAAREDALVSVSAARSLAGSTSRSRRIELVAPPPDASLLPATVDGAARWTTSRTSSSSSSRHGGPVEVEVVRLASRGPDEGGPTTLAAAPAGGRVAPRLSPPPGVKPVRPKRSGPPIEESQGDGKAGIQDERKSSSRKAAAADEGEEKEERGEREGVPDRTLALVRVEITPISPTVSLASPSPSSDWRIFYRVVICGAGARGAAVDEVTIPLSPFATSKVKVHDVWSSDGTSLKFTSDHVGRTRRGLAGMTTRKDDGPRGAEAEDEDDEEEMGLRIVSSAAAHDGRRSRRAGIAELLYEERKSGEDIEGAALLPFLAHRVGKCQVEVLDAQGYDLHVVVHDFDLSDRSRTGSSVFTKFLLRPDTRPFLPLRFKPCHSSSDPSSSSGAPSGGGGRQTSSSKKKEKEFNAAKEWLDFAYIAPMYLIAFAVILGAAIRGPPAQNAAKALNHAPPHEARVPTQATEVAATHTLPPARLVHPVISYSTVTHTQTALAVSTSTVTRTVTSTESARKSPAAPPAPQPQSLDRLAGAAPRADDDGAAGVSSEVGNSLLVWLERVRIAAREYWDEWARLLLRLAR
ncbi:hypothetical protein JCM11491_004673 [Sporobolomyces phaffii]